MDTYLVIAIIVGVVGICMVCVPCITTYFIVKNGLAPIAKQAASQAAATDANSAKHINPLPFRARHGDTILVSTDGVEWLRARFRFMTMDGCVAITEDKKLVGGVFPFYNYAETEGQN